MDLNDNGLGESEPLVSAVQFFDDAYSTRKILSQEDRLEVVDGMRLAGHSIAEIADATGVSEKTVKRDIEEIKKRNALKLNPAFATEMVGELIRKAGQHWQSLKSMARDQSGKTNERILAEKLAWDVELNLCRELREMGYLPSAPKTVMGQISHQVNVSADNTWEEIFQQFQQLKELAVDHNGVVNVEIQQTLELLGPEIQDGIARQKAQETLSASYQKIKEVQDGKERRIPDVGEET